jgi:hypothetical protein
VEELGLVNGATWSVLFGEDANRNGVLDPNEDDGVRSAPWDNADGRLERGILDFVTVYSREPNMRSDGTARLNVNTAGGGMRALLEEAFGEERAGEIQGRLGAGGNYQSLVEFFIRSGMTPEEFDLVAGDLTVADGEYREGLINVNTASEVVLACVPGIDEEQAGQLVATRQQRAVASTSVAWVVSVLGEQSAVQAGPYLTAQSWQVSVDVAAVGRHGRGYRRTLCVVDASGESPRVVYRRDLGPLGWAWVRG